MRIAIAAAAAALAATPLATAYAQSAPAVSRGDPGRGSVLYQACMACHSLDEDDIGPRHRGVFGRTAGAVPGYAYSAALRNSGLVWDRGNLDRWLTNPQALVPGAKMFFSMANAEDRRDVISYLEQLPRSPP